MKGLRIATRCTSIDQFVAAFHRFCDNETFFISTHSTRPIGLETAFSVELSNGSPALRGIGKVLEAWATPENPFGRPGIKLGIRRLTTDSEPVFQQLLAARRDVTTRTPAPRPPALAEVIVKSTPRPSVQPAIALGTTETPRTPGSELVLPANPLMNLSDESLEGFIDCTLWEETANYFPIEPDALKDDPNDPVAPPPTAVSAIATPLSLAPPANAVALPEPVRTPLSPAFVSPAVEPARPPRAAGTPPAVPIVPRLHTEPATPIELDPAVHVLSPLTTTVEPPSLDDDVDISPGRWQALGKKRGLILGGAGALIAMLVVVIVLASGSSGASHEVAKPAPPPARSEVVAVNAPPPRPPDTALAVGHAGSADVRAPTPADDPAPADDGKPAFGSGPCKIVVSTTPAGSIVTVDGELAGPSPITLRGPCQSRKIDIAHPRYQSVTRTVTSKPEGQALEVTLARPTHDLYVETQPAGATISIDGRRAGVSPTLVKIMGFTTLEVAIAKPGFQRQSKKIYSKTLRDRTSIQLVREGKNVARTVPVRSPR